MLTLAAVEVGADDAARYRPEKEVPWPSIDKVEEDAVYSADENQHNFAFSSKQLSF